MESVSVNGVELEYEARGAGESVLLIDMLIADCGCTFGRTPIPVMDYRILGPLEVLDDGRATPNSAR